MRCNTGANPPGAEFQTPEDESFKRVIHATNETTKALKEIVLELHKINEKLNGINNELRRK